MISICICSTRPQMVEELKLNIQETIGCNFEILVADNRNTGKGICAVYNALARGAKYDTLCFIHEDLAFKTPEWGTKLLNILSDKSIGLVGVAGGKYKSKHIGLAYNATSPDMLRINILQQDNGKVKHDLINPDNLLLEEVVSVDGVFLACDRSTWHENQFDEHILKGFHFYDMDFSLQIGSSKKVLVTYEILLEHFSMGTLDHRWYGQAVIAHKKWHGKLPRTTARLSSDQLDQLEYDNASFLFFFLIKHKFPRGQKLLQLFVLMQLRPFRKYNLNLLMLALKS